MQGQLQADPAPLEIVDCPLELARADVHTACGQDLAIDVGGDLQGLHHRPAASVDGGAASRQTEVVTGGVRKFRIGDL